MEVSRRALPDTVEDERADGSQEGRAASRDASSGLPVAHSKRYGLNMALRRVSGTKPEQILTKTTYPAEPGDWSKSNVSEKLALVVQR